MWELDKDCELGFERRDTEIGAISKLEKDFFFGFYNNFEELEVEVFLYKNRGEKGSSLINAKPMPDFILLAKGEDPGDFLGQLARKISSTRGVHSVVPVKMNNFLKIKELIYI